MCMDTTCMHHGLEGLGLGFGLKSVGFGVSD